MNVRHVKTKIEKIWIFGNGFGNFFNEGSESRNIDTFKFHYYYRILQTKIEWIDIQIIKKRAVHKIIHFYL